jgi:hypothetical protein
MMRFKNVIWAFVEFPLYLLKPHYRVLFGALIAEKDAINRSLPL